VSSGGLLTRAGLATAVALITAREDPEVARKAVLEGCDLAEALRGMEEIAAIVMSSLPSGERERLPQFFGLTAIKASAAAGEG
jgi:hypothetical protein